MKSIRNRSLAVFATLFFASFGIANASTLSVTCSGAPTTNSIAWSSNVSGGVTPVALLWNNGATSSSQTLSVTPGTYSATIQATDASSSVATSTCSATVVVPTNDQLSLINQQINNVLAQIASLKTQLAQLVTQKQTIEGQTVTTSTSTGQCFSFDSDLENGEHGDQVMNLQKVLASDPTILTSELETGYYGHKTEEAVKKFQHKFGLRSTGYFGPMSRKFFEQQCQTGDKDRDGVPDSIDQNDQGKNENEGDRNATSSMMGVMHGGEHEGGTSSHHGD